MGSQWPGMGKKMMDIDVFRNSILKLDVILKPYGVNLFDCIMSPDEETFKSIVNAFVCIIAIQVSIQRGLATGTVVTTKSDSDIIFCLQLLSQILRIGLIHR